VLIFDLKNQEKNNREKGQKPANLTDTATKNATCIIYLSPTFVPYVLFFIALMQHPPIHTAGEDHPVGPTRTEKDYLEHIKQTVETDN